MCFSLAYICHLRIATLCSYVIFCLYLHNCLINFYIWNAFICVDASWIFIYIGVNFTGGISQLHVFGRDVSYLESLWMFEKSTLINETSLLAKWTGFPMLDYWWSWRQIPSTAKSGHSVCESGHSGEHFDNLLPFISYHLLLLKTIYLNYGCSCFYPMEGNFTFCAFFNC